MAYALEPSAKDMERTVRLADAVRERHGRRRQPGSQFDDELAAAGDTRAGQHLHDGVGLAGLRIIVAGEHLESLAALVRSESTIYSVYTVARTAAEVAARAWWLLDPSIGGADRAQRSLADELYSLDRREDLGGELAGNARARREELRRLADDENLHVKDRNRRPGGTALMREVFGIVRGHDDDQGAIVYRLLSAFTHGTGYALNMLLEPTGEPDAEGLLPTQVQTGVAWEATVCLMAFRPYRAALDAQRRLHGWHASGLLSQAAYTSAGLRLLIDRHHAGRRARTSKP